MGELATSTDARAVAASNSDNLLAQIIAAASDPDVDPAKMETMANLAIKLQAHEQQQRFNRDLNAAILEMPVITKDGKIVIKKDGKILQSTPFARFEDIDRIVRPIAARHSLTYTFRPGGSLKEGLTMECVIRHANGHVENCGALPLPLESSGSKNNTQAVGSSVTYGKRYALCAAFSIVTEGLDNDGRGHDTGASLPAEREQVVLADAEAAAAAGNYPAHYMNQSVRDRAWLVASGNDSRLRGEALTDQRPSPPPPPPPPPPQDEPERKERRTPEQLVADYISAVNGCETRDALVHLQATSERFLQRIKAMDDGKLWNRITDAHEVALDRLAD